MSFGGDADEAASAALYARCRDTGINFFDCANVYSGGRAEEILGRLMAPERDDLVITTKVAGGIGSGPNARGTSRRHLTMQVENSLERLGTDRIDIYFLHHFHGDTAMEETLRALDDLVVQGKVLYPAVSNWSAWQIALALGMSEMRGWARFACLQPMYNLVKRQAEVELLPLAQHQGMGVITYSPLAGGLLTGKYGAGKQPYGSRLFSSEVYTRRYAGEGYREVAGRFVKYAKDCGTHPATLAVAWAAGHPAVTAPIIGARNLEQLECSLAAADLEITDEMRREISALSPRPSPATDRSEKAA